MIKPQDFFNPINHILSKEETPEFIKTLEMNLNLAESNIASFTLKIQRSPYEFLETFDSLEEAVKAYNEVL
jgi:hypothetical protein